MKRILLGLVGLTALLFVGRTVLRALAPDEAKIRRRIERMVGGYNLGRAGRVVGPLDRDWRHEGYALDRETLRGAVFHMSRSDRDPDTNELRSRVELLPDELLIEVDGDRATITVGAAFSRLRDGAWEETWRIRVEGELEKDEGTWEIVRSRHEDLVGTQLSR